MPRRPLSTYRLQITPSFGFQDAARLVPYLKELGVTDVYISPPFSASPGSTHGYDVVDHNTLRAELGGPEGYDALCRAITDAGMGQLLDFVPNHMGIGPTNPWWIEVLENGPSSVYAPYFDIEWQPVKNELRHKVLVPLLGDQYGEVLERGELKLTRDGGAFFVKYWEHCFPIAPRQVPAIIGHRLDELRAELGATDVHVQELESIITALEKLAPRDEVSPDAVTERAREKEVAKRRLHALFEACPRVAQAVDDTLAMYNGTPGDARSFDQLDALLDAQAYRLAHWRVAGEEINYRRFFDINSLAAIRVEDERVFNDVHRLVFQLIREGKVTGLRIDHPDGLYAPSAYFRRLRQEFAGLYVVVEKILEGNEKMPLSWEVDGTTGYEFLNALNGLFVDGSNAGAFSGIYARFTGITERWPDLVVDRKRRLMRSSMASEINMLSHRLNRLSESNRRTRDFTMSALTSALSDFVARMPIYRTYVEGNDAASVEQRDRQYIESTIRAAKRGSRELNRSLYDFLRSILLLENPTDESREFVRKLQQVTGPVTAKATEDTAFYVYNRLVALNEVGGDPQKFGVPVEEFHQHNLERLRHWPGSLNTTATHDTKRGEDVRLRIDALSEIPVEWEQHISRWAQLAVGFKTALDGGEKAPDANDELLVYQTLVGTFPDDGLPTDEYRARIGQYLDKGLKEAKVHTSWTNPDETYEKATRDFADGLLSSAPFISEFQRFMRRIGAAARISSLAQVALKVGAPGVPDVYQGCELWDLSLVDPDNRRPVDYAQRARLLEALGRRLAEGDAARLQLAREVAQPAALVDGRAKLLLLREALRYRRDHGALFLEGAYVPLAVDGPDAAHVIAFARQHGDERIIVAVPRLTLQLLDRNQGVLRVAARVRLPDGCRQTLVNVVTGRRHDAVDGALDLSEVWGDFPVGLLSCSRA